MPPAVCGLVRLGIEILKIDLEGETSEETAAAVGSAVPASKHGSAARHEGASASNGHRQ